MWRRNATHRHNLFVLMTTQEDWSSVEGEAWRDSRVRVWRGRWNGCIVPQGLGHWFRCLCCGERDGIVFAWVERWTLNSCPSQCCNANLHERSSHIHGHTLCQQEGYLLHKSKVAMYISERINIEIVAMFKDCESVPFLRKYLSKLGDQMYTTKDWLSRCNTCTPVSILGWVWHLKHHMLQIWCGWEGWKPFDICKMSWWHGFQCRKHIINGRIWDLKYHTNLSDLMTCITIS